MRPVPLLLFILCLSASACYGPRLRPDWPEAKVVEVQGLKIVTKAPSQVVQFTLEEYQSLRKIIESSPLNAFSPPLKPVTIYIYDTEEEFDELKQRFEFSENLSGFYVRPLEAVFLPRLDTSPLLRGEKAHWETLRHELTHHFHVSHIKPRRAAWWLSEGFAHWTTHGQTVANLDFIREGIFGKLDTKTSPKKRLAELLSFQPKSTDPQITKRWQALCLFRMLLEDKRSRPAFVRYLFQIDSSKHSIDELSAALDMSVDELAGRFHFFLTQVKSQLLRQPWVIHVLLLMRKNALAAATLLKALKNERDFESEAEMIETVMQGSQKLTESQRDLSRAILLKHPFGY